ncbi:MAG TPA: AAA family ATPase, partial [Bacteroidia bacterium]|nr:AAA family ATPase [Bacteroidia bacterium]
MIQRKIALRLKQLMRQFPAVGIIGPRQCGKTTLAMEVKKQLGDKALYFDLENPEDNARFHDPALLLKEL